MEVSGEELLDCALRREVGPVLGSHRFEAATECLTECLGSVALHRKAAAPVGFVR